MRAFHNKRSSVPADIYPLSMACCRTDVYISHAHAGFSLRQKLCGMGLPDGAKVRILKNGRKSPMLLAVGHTRLIIGRGVAQKIMVCPHPEIKQSAI
ncbi:MAG: ferrous iron transport protein A [Alphaproteobacteria bacterium]